MQIPLVFTTLLIGSCLAVTANAQITFDGCVDSRGVPVASLPNLQLADIAMAMPNPYGASVIQYNPGVLSWVKPATRLFFYVHECAHLAIPTSNESVADCWAIRTLINKGLVDEDSVESIQNDIAQFGRGDWTHLPGPMRAISLRVCIAQSQ